MQIHNWWFSFCCSANYGGDMTWSQSKQYCLDNNLAMRLNMKPVENDHEAFMNRLRRLDHPSFVHVTDKATEGVWINSRRVKYSYPWDPEAPERANSEERDYMAIIGAGTLLAQAYTETETGPDIVCTGYDRPWNKLKWIN